MYVQCTYDTAKWMVKIVLSYYDGKCRSLMDGRGIQENNLGVGQGVQERQAGEGGHCKLLIMAQLFNIRHPP